MISVCPNCETKVSVAEGSQLGQVFECPHCQAEFELTVVLQQDAIEVKPADDESASNDGPDSFGAGILDDVVEDSAEDLKVADDGEDFIFDFDQEETIAEDVAEDTLSDQLIEDPLEIEPAADSAPVEIEVPDFEDAEDSQEIEIADELEYDEHAVSEDTVGDFDGLRKVVGNVDNGVPERTEHAGDPGELVGDASEYVVEDGDSGEIEFELSDLEADIAAAEPAEFDLTADDDRDFASSLEYPATDVDGVIEPMPEFSLDGAEEIDFSGETSDSVEATKEAATESTEEFADTADLFTESDVFEAAAASVAQDSGESASTGESGLVEVAKPFDLPPANVQGDKFKPGLPGRRGNRLRVVAKVLLGTLAGLILAQVIAWWGFQKDPIGLVSKLGPLSSLAPSSLRSPSSPPPVTTTPTALPHASNDASDETTAAETPSIPAPTTTQDAFPLETVDRGTDSDGDLRADAPGDDFPELPDTGSPDAGLPGTGLPGTGLPDAEFPDNEFPDNELPDNELPDTGFPDTGTTTTTPEKLTLLKAPEYSWTDLSRALTAANTSKAAFDVALSGQTSGKEKVTKASEFYEACCKLAEKATFVKSSADHPVHGEVDLMLQSAAAKNIVAIVMGRLPRGRMANSPSGSGICLSGTVQASRPIQGGMEHVIQLLDKPDLQGPVITGIQAIDPSEPAAAPTTGGRVIVLGVLVKDPKTELSSHESSSQPVVWIGQITPIQ